MSHVDKCYNLSLSDRIKDNSVRVTEGRSIKIVLQTLGKHMTYLQTNLREQNEVFKRWLLP